MPWQRAKGPTVVPVRDIRQVTAPVALGLLALVVPGTGGLGPLDVAERQEAAQILVLLFVGAAFAGGASAAREVVAERAILVRERTAGLSRRRTP